MSVIDITSRLSQNEYNQDLKDVAKLILQDKITDVIAIICVEDRYYGLAYNGKTEITKGEFRKMFEERMNKIESENRTME